MTKTRLSNPQLLSTLKRIAFEEEEQEYPQNKAKRENGFILKHKVTNLKVKQLVVTFSRKLRRNLTSSAPVDFILENPIERDNSRWFQGKGWDIQDHFQGFVIFLDIIMSIVCLIISAYQGFLDDFRNGDCSSSTIIALKCISIVIFVTRILMGMVTVDYVDDQLYLYITDIVIKELKGGNIIIRTFSLFMVAYSLASPGSQTVGIIFFFSSVLELFVVQQNLKILQLLFIDSIRKFYIWNLMRVVIFDIIFGHLIAVALLAISNINPESNWVTVKLVNNNFIDASLPWYKLYIWSYYWACTIMMTVGFGDISPVDYRESIVIAFIQIFSSIVLAYNISEVGSIVTKMRTASQTLQRKFGVLRRMAKKNPVPDELGWKIESYLSHETEILDKFQYNEHHAIIESLPQQLKHEYYLEENQQLYQSIPVFRHFQKETHAKLNRAFKGRVYYPGENIIRHRAEFNKLIIIRMGQFDLTYWKQRSELNGTVVQTISISEKDCNGILATNNILSRNTKLNYDIVASKYSYGMQLKYEEFVSILQQNSLDYYFYRSVVDKHEKEINSYGYVMCEYCQNQYHTRFQCTRLHYIPIKSEVIYRYRNSKDADAKRTFKTLKPKAFVKHAYLLRKKLFGILQGLLSMTSETEPQQQLQLDNPWDFSMYFKENNPEMLKHQQLNKSKASSLYEMSKRRSLKRMSVNGQIPL